jgi:hypothetical protein
LVFQGLKRYATSSQQADFARKSVALFMKNWTAQRVCGENFLSTDGTQNRDPHYTWGALLNLVGIESICDVEPDGGVRLNASLKQTVHLRQIPINGVFYEIDAKPGRTELLHYGVLNGVSTMK